jgi:hypothetical protein
MSRNTALSTNRVFGGKKAYNDVIRRDKLKKQLCEEYNIKMIYVDNNTDFNDLKLR